MKNQGMGDTIQGFYDVIEIVKRGPRTAEERAQAVLAQVLLQHLLFQGTLDGCLEPGGVFLISSAPQPSSVNTPSRSSDKNGGRRD